VEEPRGSKHQSNIERSHPIEDQIKIMKPKTKGVNKSEVFRSSNKTTRKKYDEHKIKQTEEPTHTNQHRFSKTELNTNTTKNTQSGYKKACYDETEAISIENINERNDQTKDSSNNEKQLHSKQKRYSQIRLTQTTMSNMHFGDEIPSSDENDIILFHNINGMKDPTHWFQIMMTMQELNVSIFGFAEINKSLNRGYNQDWKDTIRKIFYYSRTTHSESKVQTETSYKPGGTMTTIKGKWQSRVTSQGQDPRGLGRWSYMRIASKKSAMIIATAYQPCVSQGPNTAWIQQWSLLREYGDRNPDPIKYFYSDLEKQILEWKSQGNEVLMMIDANEFIGDKPGGLTTIFGKMGMTELIRHRHPNATEPNTHVRGSKRIDYIFGTQKIRDNCEKAGILPFGVGYQSDHRAIFIEINIKQILNTQVQAIDTITARKLQRATPKEREIFIQETHRYLENNNIYQRL
jgi:hypothetical protein